MAGGSREPDGIDDFQCQNCGLWFARVGLSSHERGCKHPEWAEPLVELVDVDEHPMMTGNEESDDQKDVIDEVEEMDADDQERVVDDAPAPAEPVTATDGGNPIFDGPDPDPTPATTDGGDPGDDPSCPDCGSSHYYVVDELGNVPEEYQQFDFVCAECKELYNE